MYYKGSCQYCLKSNGEYCSGQAKLLNQCDRLVQAMRTRPDVTRRSTPSRGREGLVVVAGFLCHLEDDWEGEGRGREKNLIM